MVPRPAGLAALGWRFVLTTGTGSLFGFLVARQAYQSALLAPLFIVWFGFGLLPTVVMTALICFFPLLENTLTGLDRVDPAKRELFRMLRAGRWRTLTRLKIPSGLPVILAGLRVAVVLALAAVGLVLARGTVGAVD